MITLTRKQKRKPFARQVNFEEVARKVLDNHCHFRGRTDDFQFEDCEGVLRVRGRVPSFYLRQLLESILRRADGIQSVDNRVDVVCCNGLSSVRYTGSNP